MREDPAAVNWRGEGGGGQPRDKDVCTVWCSHNRAPRMVRKTAAVGFGMRIKILSRRGIKTEEMGQQRREAQFRHRRHYDA